jgi:raffinose/stachyose/melibiose transport system substrate-binding protein
MQRKYLYSIVGIAIILIAAFSVYWVWQNQTSGTTLQFWAPFAGEPSVDDFWGNVSAAYKNATGVNVQVSMYTGDEFFTKITTALGSGAPPDLFTTYGGGELDTYVNESAVADISALYSEAWAQAQIPANAKATETRNGHQYAIPYELQTDWLFINRALFNKYNITIPSIDNGWTWDQFQSACDTFKANGIVPVAMSGADTWALTFPECYMFERANGPQAFEQALARQTNFTNYYENAFTKIQQWVNSNDFQSGWTTAHYDSGALPLFQNGQAAMWIQGTWGVGMVQDNASIPFEMGVAQWPYFADHPEANKYIFGEYTSVAVADASKHKSQAEDFLRFISNATWIVTYAQQTYNPVAQSVTLPANTYPPVMANIQTAVNTGPGLIVRYGSQAPSALASTLDTENLLVFTGQATPLAAAQADEAKAVSVLGPVHG